MCLRDSNVIIVCPVLFLHLVLFVVNAQHQNKLHNTPYDGYVDNKSDESILGRAKNIGIVGSSANMCYKL